MVGLLTRLHLRQPAHDAHTGVRLLQFRLHVVNSRLPDNRAPFLLRTVKANDDMWRDPICLSLS